MKAKFSLDECVWFAQYRHNHELVPCPVCYGEKSVVVILGNEDRVTVECAYCERGTFYSTGKVSRSRFLPIAKMGFVTSVTESSDSVEYRLSCTEVVINNAEQEEVVQYTRSLPEGQVFATKDEAFVAAELLAKKATEEAESGDHIKGNMSRSFTWNVGYHMREAKRAKKDLAYHEKMAVLCKAEAKNEKKGDRHE